jgi:hypothetical protein
MVKMLNNSSNLRFRDGLSGTVRLRRGAAL